MIMTSKEHLHEEFQFTDADLELNRRGVLSEAQVVNVNRWIREQRLIFAGYALLFIVPVVCIASQGGFKGPPFVLIVVALIIARIWSFLNQDVVPTREAMQRRQVEYTQGTLKLVKVKKGERVVRVSSGKLLRATPSQMNLIFFLNEQPFIVYYCGKLIVAVEPLPDSGDIP